MDTMKIKPQKAVPLVMLNVNCVLLKLNVSPVMLDTPLALNLAASSVQINALIAYQVILEAVLNVLLTEVSLQFVTVTMDISIMGLIEDVKSVMINVQSVSKVHQLVLPARLWDQEEILLLTVLVNQVSMTKIMNV